MGLDLTQVESGKKMRVVAVYGGMGFIRKLEAMGIRVGVVVEKVSNQFLRGPVVIKIGGTQVALGFGMAKRIIVDDK